MRMFGKYYKHVVIGFFAIIFAFSSVTLAATDSSANNKPQATTNKKPTKQAPKQTLKQQKESVKKAEVSKEKLSKGLIAQTFPLHGSAELRLQFRYIKGKLKYLYFWNAGNEPLVINVLSSNYVIGEGDEVSIKAPTVENIVINVSPYTPVEHVAATDELTGTSLDLQKTYVFIRGSDGLYELKTLN